MRVVCENCGTTYKIPETKLVKEVNKATCRNCGFRMMIRRPSAAAASAADGTDPDPEDAATQVTANPLQRQDHELEVLDAETRIEDSAVDDWNDDSPTNVQDDPTAPPAAGSAAPRPKPSAPKAAPGPGRKAETDMVLALVATFASAGGAMLLATNTGDVAFQRMLGLGVALWGALTCLFLLVTGNLWRQQGNLTVSVALATILSVAGSAFVEIALHDGQGLGVTSGETRADASTPAPNSRNDAYLRADMADNGAANTTDAGAEAATASASSASPDAKTEPEPPEVAALSPSNGQSAPPVVAKPPTSSTGPSSDRATPDDDELDLEDPIEDFDELGEPDLDAVASVAPDADDGQRRRAEEQQRAAERERRERESQRAAAQERRQREAAAKAKAAKEKAAKENAAGGSKMATLPLTVVDTMIRSNMSVKRCFFNEKQASGEMPRRVIVRFTVLNSGRVSSARVTTEQYKGGTLDGCLGRAFKAIQFPAFQGEAKSMTYPFVL